MKQTSIFKHVNGKKPTASRDFQFDLPIDSKDQLNKIQKSDIPTAATTKDSQRLLRSKQRAAKKPITITVNKADVQAKVNKKRKIDEVNDLRQDQRSPKKMKVDQVKATVANQKIEKPLKIQVKKPKGEQKPKIALSAATLKMLGKARGAGKPPIVPKKPVDEDQISFDKLGGSFNASSEAEEQKDEIPKISSQTKSLIANLKRSHPAPVIVTDNHGLSFKDKHQDLLKTNRQIIIPAKYRALIQLQNYLDMTINFLKSRGKLTEFIPLKEIQTSIAKSQGKFFSITNFRQILFMQPTFYEHKWIMNTSISQNEPQLCIKNRGAQMIINKQEQDNRQKLFTEAIISHTEKIHFKFIQKLSETEIVDPIFNDPIGIQMWHSKFEPHSNPLITDIPMAALDAQPNHLIQHKSGTVKDFIKNITPRNQNIAQRAIREASEEADIKDAKNSPTSNKLSTPQNVAPPSDPKLVQMSQKFGISLKTLQLIDDKRKIQEENKMNLTQTLEDQNAIKLVQEYTSLQEMIRHQFSIKQKTSLSLSDLAGFIQTGSTKFSSKGQIMSQIVKMSEMVPELITVKQIMLKGKQTKFVKFGGKNISSAEVNEKLKQKLA